MSSRDGLIQRFEFTFEPAWSTLKAIFEDEGLRGLNSPKTVLSEAFVAGLINDSELWLSMLRDRNSTTHMYNVAAAVEICAGIRKKYVQELDGLLGRMEERVDG